MVPIIEGGRNYHSGGGVVLLVTADVCSSVCSFIRPAFCHSLIIENTAFFLDFVKIWLKVVGLLCVKSQIKSCGRENLHFCQFLAIFTQNGSISQ